MKRIFAKLKNLIPSKRKLIQLYSALLFNANLKGFANGRIYQGKLKNICTPGLNCYSCPGASGACPLGSMQNALSSSEKRTPYYVFGIIILYGILLGRIICGFLCPFGLIQELLYKIKTPKLKKNRVTRVLSYFKYVILVFLVVIVPILYGLRNVPLPGFCKYICPAGTIEGCFGLLANKVNSGLFASLGPLFTWKFILAVSIIVGSVFIFRVFCRFICPLGALYGLFNRFAILGIKLERPKCTDCGLCISKCKMDISKVGDHECINCGECVSVCPTQAISWRGGRIILPPDEIAPITPDMSEEQRQECIDATEARNCAHRRRRTVTRVIAAVVMSSLLVGALVYYNFIDKPASSSSGSAGGEDTVYSEGSRAPDVDIPLFNGVDGYTAGTFNPSENLGKVTVLNFWHTQCNSCMHELPYFESVADAMPDDVTVIAVTKRYYMEESYQYIKDNYTGSSIIWGTDSTTDPDDVISADDLYTSLGGTGAYPITVIIDREGNIYKIQIGGMTEAMLTRLVKAAYASTN